MTRNITALLLASTLALSSPVQAGLQEGDASFSVNAGSFMFDNAERLDDGPVIGARLGYDMHRNLGLEGSFGFADTRSNISASKPQAYVYTYRADLLLYLLPDSSFVPFLTVGGGIMNLTGSELWGERTSLLLEYGAGIKYFLSDRLALRADGRNLFSFDNNRHSHIEVTGGISYYFNKVKSPPAKVASADIVAPAAVAEEQRPAAAKQTEPAAAATDKDVPAVKQLEPAPAISREPVAESQPAAASVQVPKAAPSQAEPLPVAPAPEVTPIPALAPPVATEAPCASPVKISRIVTVPNGFEIQSDSPLSLPRIITLANPTRLALDIDCAAYGIGSKTLPFDHSGAAVIRIGNYIDKLRVVFDFNRATLPAYEVVRSSQGIKVLFGNPENK